MAKPDNNDISCEVCNCKYHDGVAKCTADCIHVGPSYACSSAETICATFRPEEK